MTPGAVALLCFAAGMVLPWWGGFARRIGWLVVLAGTVLCAVTGIVVLADGTRDVSSAIVTGFDGSGPGLVLHVDPLAALFLLLVGAVGTPAVLVCTDWSARARSPRASTVAAAALLMFACVLVIGAADVWTLVIGWEGVSLAFYWLTMQERERAGRVSAALGAVGFGKASGALLTIGLMICASQSHSFRLAAFADGSGHLRGVAYLLVLAAFATKVGLVPLHGWLPPSYASAPGPVRALMAGVAVNVGFYGCWRTFDVLGTPPGWLAVGTLLLGGLSAIVGIAHASVQTRLTRVVAYSSVENAGLIVAAYGIGLVGAATGHPALQATGMLAATLQVIAHALGKTLLFASAGVIVDAVGSDVMDRLRGLRRRFPWSGTGLALGAVTMAGLPPTVVFVSEWFILESLMQQFRLEGHLAYALPMALTGALVALTTGFAGVAFIRLVAFTVLGPGDPDDRHPRGEDVGVPGRVALVVLAAACVAAAPTPWEIRLIARGLAPIVSPHLIGGATSDSGVLGPVYQGFSVLAPTWLCIELPAVLVLVWAMSRLLGGSRMWRVRTVPPWRSATGGVSGADEYTPFGYANPTRRVLANVLMPHAEVSLLEEGERSRTGAALAYRSDVVEITEHFVYRPVVTVARRLVAVALRLQNGRLDAYLCYVLVALVAVVAVVAAGW